MTLPDRITALLDRRGPTTKYTIAKALRPRRMAPLNEALLDLLDAGQIDAIPTPRGGTAYLTTRPTPVATEKDTP